MSLILGSFGTFYQFLVGLTKVSLLLFALCFILYCLLCFFRQEVHRWRLYRAMPSIPTSTLPGSILGHLEYLLIGVQNLDILVFFPQLLSVLAKICHSKKEGIVYIRFGPCRHFVCIFNARAAEAVLSNTQNLRKAPEYDFLKDWLGESLLTAHGSQWRKHRKLLTPAFHFEILNMFIPIINSQLATLRSIINSRMSPNGSIALIADIRPLVANCVMDIFCQTSLGVPVNAQLDWAQLQDSPNVSISRRTPESAYVEAVRGFFDLFLHRLLRPWLFPSALFPLFPSGRQSAEYVRRMHAFTNAVIQRRKQALKRQISDCSTLQEAMSEVGQSKRLAFLDLLLVHHLKGGEKALDLVAVQEEMDVFMFAGTDTTTTALTFALLLIGLNLEVQAGIHAELDAIFPDDSERDISREDTTQMTYLEMAIKETMRLYPSIAFFGRTVVEELTVDGYSVPAGTSVMLFSSAIHRDPEWYEKAEHFCPERFSASEWTSPRNAYAYLPFSHGARNCIGQRYAMLQMKVFLAALLRHYTVRSLTQRDELRLNSAIVTKAITPIQMEFCKRRVKW